MTQRTAQPPRLAGYRRRSKLPVYSLALRGAGEATRARIAELPWVADLDVTRRNGATVWQVSVIDEDAAEAELLRRVLADEGVTVTEFSRKRYELEEIFMDIVGGNDGRR